MTNGWLDNVPHYPRPYTGVSFRPVGNVEHRTIGTWTGDFAVLSRGRVPSVHFLVGQQRGQWVQFYSIYTTCAHAAGANNYAVGIEFSGQNGEPLTAWQIEAGREIHRQLVAAGIKPNFKANGTGRVSHWEGFLNHSNVLTEPRYTHYDYITSQEFQRMVEDMAITGQEFMQIAGIVENVVRKHGEAIIAAIKQVQPGQAVVSAQDKQDIAEAVANELAARVKE